MSAKPALNFEKAGGRMRCQQLMSHGNKLSKWRIQVGLSAGLFAMMLLSACFGKLVDVNVTVVDEKTALENQILGSYEELGNEMTLLASVRSVDESGKLKSVPEIPPGKRKAIRAMQRKEFNRDDIANFKKLGCAGESNDGLLVFIEVEKTRTDPKFKKFQILLFNFKN